MTKHTVAVTTSIIEDANFYSCSLRLLLLLLALPLFLLLLAVRTTRTNDETMNNTYYRLKDNSIAANSTHLTARKTATT